MFIHKSSFFGFKMITVRLQCTSHFKVEICILIKWVDEMDLFTFPFHKSSFTEYINVVIPSIHDQYGGHHSQKYAVSNVKVVADEHTSQTGNTEQPVENIKHQRTAPRAKTK